MLTKHVGWTKWRSHVRERDEDCRKLALHISVTVTHHTASTIFRKLYKQVVKVMYLTNSKDFAIEEPSYMHVSNQPQSTFQRSKLDWQPKEMHCLASLTHSK